MSMTRKDFEALADVLRHAREDAAADWTAQDALDYVAQAIATYCVIQNNRFDIARFFKAASA